MAITPEQYRKIFRDNPGISQSDFIKKCKAIDPSVSDDNVKIMYGLMKSTGGTSSTTNATLSMGAGGLAGLTDVFSSQSSYGRIDSGETFGIGESLKDLLNIKGTGAGKLDLLKNLSGQIVTQNLQTILENIGNQLKIESQLRTDINEKTGMAGDLADGYRQTIVETLPDLKRFQYGVNDIVDLQSNLMTKSGRFNMISRETMSESAKTARAFVGNLSDMGEIFANFESIGVGVDSSLAAINKAGKDSLSIGLNSRQTIRDLRENIGKLNEYGFKNGIQGLAEMSRKAKEFRMDMSEVFKIADKVMNPEGAIELAANLQVLGGAIGDFGDPLKMMYDATNNVEGLQDALIGAAGSLATYNSEQGRFEITGVNLRRAKEMANQLGISYQELAKGAIASQERMMASSALMAKGLDLPEKDKEFITNLSKMEGGQMVISIPDNLADKFGGKLQLSLDELTAQQIEALKANRKQLEEMSTEEIAKGQFDAIKNIESDVDAFLTAQRTQVTKFARGKEGLDLDNQFRELQKAIGQEVTTTLKTGKGKVLGNITDDDIRKTIDDALKNPALQAIIGPNASLQTYQNLQSKLVEDIKKQLDYKSPTNTGTVNTTNLNITSDVTTDIMARNLLRSDQVWQDIFTRNPRDYTSIGL